MKEYILNKNNNFIEGYYLSNLSICDNLINLFESSKDKVVGETSTGIDKNIKDSTDLTFKLNDISKHESLKLYFEQLIKFLNIYKNKYKFCEKAMSKWGVSNEFNIQKYKPSQAYHKWHCEKACFNTAYRHLVFMTYLNTIKKGGETEWYYQKLKIKPEKGLTFIWSADWTFTHKGNSTIDENKYIITGWLDLLLPK